MIGEVRLGRVPVRKSHVPFMELAGWCCEPFGGTQRVYQVDHGGLKEVWRWFLLARHRRFESHRWHEFVSGNPRKGEIIETALYEESLLDRMQLALTWGCWAWEHEWHGLGVERYPLCYSVRELCLLCALIDGGGSGVGREPWPEAAADFHRWVKVSLRGKDGVLDKETGAWPKVDREYWSTSSDAQYESEVNRRWRHREDSSVKGKAPSSSDVAAHLGSGGRLLPAGSSPGGDPDGPRGGTGLARGWGA